MSDLERYIERQLGEKQAEIDRQAAKIERLRAAIREHRDQEGDDRCWLDDMRLYNALDEGQEDCTLPPKCEFLKSCERYWEQRQSPGEKAASESSEMTIGQLERDNADLRRRLEAATKERDEIWALYDARPPEGEMSIPEPFGDAASPPPPAAGDEVADLRRRLEAAEKEADEARRTLAGILHWRLDGETVTDLAHAVEGYVGSLIAASPPPPAAPVQPAAMPDMLICPCCGRVAPEADWGLAPPGSPDPGLRCPDCWREAKSAIPHPAAPAAGEPGNPSRRCEACRSYHPDTTPCAAAWPA
jgi:hypothetical protein